MTTKICSSCKIEKLEEEYHWKVKNKRRQSMCKECLYTYQKNRWHQRKLDAIEYKGGVCEDCKQMPHPGAMQFHHEDPKEKEFSWNKGRLKSWDYVKKELDKCILLCANCHAIRHSDYKIVWYTIQDSNLKPFH